MATYEEIMGAPTADDPNNWAGIARWIGFTGGSNEDPWNWKGIEAYNQSGGTLNPDYQAYLESTGAITPRARPTNEATPVPAAPAPPTPAQQVDMSVYQYIASYLSTYGLSNLFTIGADGQPSGWLFQQMINGFDTVDEIKVAVESTPEWQTRFSVILEQRKLAQQGKLSYVMSAEDVVNYEELARSEMRNAGLPQWMWDQTNDFNALMLSGVSIPELKDRIGASYQLVQSTDPAIRDAFTAFYGVGAGDEALAAFFLNPDRTQASLDKAAKSAFAAGMGTKYGMTLDKTTSEMIASKPLTTAGIDQGLENIGKMANLFKENFGETQDLTAEEQGVGAVFSGSAEAQRLLEGRTTTRQLVNRATTGGAAQSQQGLIGVGSS